MIVPHSLDEKAQMRVIEPLRPFDVPHAPFASGERKP